MLKIKKFFTNKGPVSVVLAVVLSVLFVVGIVEAATTISANINTAGTLTVTGTSTLTGAVTLSDDLIVDTNLLFVDDSANKVGFGTTSPTALLTVGSTTPTHLTTGNQYFSAYINGELEVDGASWFDGAVTLASTLGVTGVSTLTDDLVVDTETLFVDVSANKVGFGTTSPTALLTVGSTTPSSLTAGNQYFSAYINGELEVDGASWFDGAVTLASTLDVTGNVGFDGGTFVFNNTEDDKDFRIAGDSETNLFVADASVDKIGIGTSTPLNLAHIEDASATSTLTISSGSASSGGRIIFEDTDGAGCTELSFLDGAIIHEAITCPAGI